MSFILFGTLLFPIGWRNDEARQMRDLHYQSGGKKGSWSTKILRHVHNNTIKTYIVPLAVNQAHSLAVNWAGSVQA